MMRNNNSWIFPPLSVSTADSEKGEKSDRSKMTDKAKDKYGVRAIMQIWHSKQSRVQCGGNVP